MRRGTLALLLLCTASLVHGQYKKDNVSYTTVDPATLCQLLKNNPGYLLLDVRSNGEHNDTSRSTGLNIGHLKGAKNINIGDLAKQLDQIKDYKDKPIFVYCSHSQRSRRASRLLADSGFSKVFNINGGLTSIYYRGLSTDDCFKQLLSPNAGYGAIGPVELCKKLTSGKSNITILDVRSDSAYQYISSDPQENVIGTIANNIHIPLAMLEQQLSAIPKDREIIVTDVYGSDAAKAARLLHDKGYNASFLLEGMHRWLEMPGASVSCRQQVYMSSTSAVKVINAGDFGKLVQQHADMLVIDARTPEEFTNTHKDGFRNIGRVKGAINIPLNDAEKMISDLQAQINKPVYLYEFSGGPKVYQLAAMLVSKGFKNVSVISGGLFNIRWTAANVSGQSALATLVENIPEENL